MVLGEKDTEVEGAVGRGIDRGRNKALGERIGTLRKKKESEK